MMLLGLSELMQANYLEHIHRDFKNILAVTIMHKFRHTREVDLDKYFSWREVTIFKD